MDRAKLLLGLVAICLTASACKKAKMRSVPPAGPSATTSADPGYYEPGPYQQAPEVIPGGQQPEPYNPPPRAADPIANYDDEEVRESSGEVVRPSNYDRRPAPRTETCCVTRPAPQPAPTPCCVQRPRPRPRPVVDNHENCPPEVHRTHSRPAARQPSYPRPEPVVRQPSYPRPATPAPAPAPATTPDPMDNRGRYVDLNMTTDLHCVWSAPNREPTELVYDPVRRVVRVRKGLESTWNRYDNVRAVTGVHPYGNQGFTLILPNVNNRRVVSLLPSGRGTKWDDRGVLYPYEAIYGNLPHQPRDRDMVGVCWSEDERPRGT